MQVLASPMLMLQLTGGRMDYEKQIGMIQLPIEEVQRDTWTSG
jgi:hypothetical protein